MCGESNFCSVNSSMSLWSDLYSNTSSGSEEFFLESSVECMRPSSFFKNINMDFSWSRDAPPLDDTLPLDLSVKNDHNYNQYHAFGLPPIKSILRYDGPLSQVPYSGWKTEELSDTSSSKGVDFPRHKAPRVFEQFSPSVCSTPHRSEQHNVSPQKKLSRYPSFHWKATPIESRKLKRKLENDQENQPVKRIKKEPLIKAARLIVTPAQRVLAPLNQKFCDFCKRNGELPVIYNHHTMQDAKGRTLCPVLRQIECPECHADGDAAHEIQNCPALNIRPTALSFIRRDFGVMRI